MSPAAGRWSMTGGMLFGRYRGDTAVESLDLADPAQVVIPVGIPQPDLLVKAGDRVCTGQPLVRPDQIIPQQFHLSSVTGAIAGFIPHGKGMRAPVSVIVDREATEERCSERFAMPQTADDARSVLVRSGALHACPQDTAQWLLRPGDKDPVALLVACFASGPLEASRLRLAACATSRVEEGLALWSRAVNGAPVILMVAEEEAAAWQGLDALPEGVVVHPCPRRYPAEHPVMLASRYLRRDLPGGAIPLHEGLVVVDIRGVCAAGQVVASGEALHETTVDLVGEGARRPVTMRARIGARAGDVFRNLISDDPVLFVGGGVLAGHHLASDAPLLPHHGSIVALPLPSRRFLSFMTPATNRPSWTRTVLSSVVRPRSFQARAELGGEQRPCISCGSCEDVCPRQISPSHLARLAGGGIVEEMEQLGIDRCIQCGLCSYVCPSKIELMETIRRGIEVLDEERAA